MMLALQSMTMVEPRNTSGSPAKRLLTASDEFVFLIEEVPRKLRRMFVASTARFGLTRTQWRQLANIYRPPGMPQTVLPTCLKMERTSLRPFVDTPIRRRKWREKRG